MKFLISLFLFLQAQGEQYESIDNLSPEARAYRLQCMFWLAVFGLLGIGLVLFINHLANKEDDRYLNRQLDEIDYEDD